jgi:hypothetical protein
MKEFIPEEFRWQSYDDLKEKIVRCMESTEQSVAWERKRKELWSKIAVLNPETFQDSIWSHVQTLIS